MADNPAERLARHIGRQIPIVYGGGGVGSVAARRWKTQFNENAKMPAFSQRAAGARATTRSRGWGQHGDVTRQVFRIVNLRHEFEHPQIARRFALSDDLLGEVVAGIHEVVAEGEGTLAQLFDLILFGDFVSLYCAMQRGHRPRPDPGHRRPQGPPRPLNRKPPTARAATLDRCDVGWRGARREARRPEG